MNSAGGVFLRDIFRIGELVGGPERLDEALFNPAVHVVCEAPQSPAFRVAAEVEQRRQGPADAFKQAADSVRLHAMHREFSNDLLFVFGEDRRYIVHMCFFCSLTKRNSPEAANFR